MRTQPLRDFVAPWQRKYGRPPRLDARFTNFGWFIYDSFPGGSSWSRRGHVKGPGVVSGQNKRAIAYGVGGGNDEDPAIAAEYRMFP